MSAVPFPILCIGIFGIYSVSQMAAARAGGPPLFVQPPYVKVPDMDKINAEVKDWNPKRVPMKMGDNYTGHAPGSE